MTTGAGTEVDGMDRGEIPGSVEGMLGTMEVSARVDPADCEGVGTGGTLGDSLLD